MENEKTTLQKPGFLRLLAGYILDLIIVILGWITIVPLVNVPFPWVVEKVLGREETEFLFPIFIVFTMLAWPFVYFALCQVIKKRTLGEEIVKIVPREDKLPVWKGFVVSFFDIAICFLLAVGMTFVDGLLFGTGDGLAMLGFFIISVALCYVVYLTLCKYTCGMTLGRYLLVRFEKEK